MGLRNGQQMKLMLKIIGGFGGRKVQHPSCSHDDQLKKHFTARKLILAVGGRQYFCNWSYLTRENREKRAVVSPFAQKVENLQRP